MTVWPHHLTLSNLFKGSLSYSLACKMDLSLGFNRGGIEGGLEERRESECVCACLCGCVRWAKGGKKREIKIAPLPIKKPNYHSQSARERHKESLSYNGSLV